MRPGQREATAFLKGESPAMRGGCGALLLLALLAAAPCTTVGDVAQPPPPAASSDGDPGDVVDPELVRAEAAWLRDAETALLAQQLARMLRQAEPDGAGEDARWRGDQSALVMDTAAADAFAAGDQPLPDALQDADPSAGVWAVGKRSRYYRRYPWKRQPGRGGGLAVDADNPYMCNPTREDVFRLLAALHDARAGNLGRTVSFCNRRRPAAAVFTNIRFLGRRR